MIQSNKILCVTGVLILMLATACNPTEETTLGVIVAADKKLFTIPSGSTEPLIISTSNACDISIIAIGADADGVASTTIIAQSGARLTRSNEPGGAESGFITEMSSEEDLPTSITTGGFVVPRAESMVFGFTVESEGGEVFNGPSLTINIELEEEFACLGGASTSCIWDFSGFSSCPDMEEVNNSRCFKFEFDDNREQRRITFSKRIRDCIGAHADGRVSRFRLRLEDDTDNIQLFVYRNSTDDPLKRIFISEPNVWFENEFDDWTINSNWIFETPFSGAITEPEGLVMEVELEPL